MSDPSAPEAKLGAIRSLIEHEPDYRESSVRVAAVGGALALLAAVGLIRMDSAGDMTVRLFLGTWLAVLALTLTVAFLQLSRAARQRGESVFSSRFGMASRAMLPPFLCAAVLTFYNQRNPTLLPESWILFYGLGLLATAPFAPRSIVVLGWAFVLAGIGFWYLPWMSMRFFSPFSRPAAYACLEMGLTFGLFHLVYALRVSSSEKAGENRAGS